MINCVSTQTELNKESSALRATLEDVLARYQLDKCAHATTMKEYDRHARRQSLVCRDVACRLLGLKDSLDNTMKDLLERNDKQRQRQQQPRGGGSSGVGVEVGVQYSMDSQVSAKTLEDKLSRAKDEVSE